MLERLLGAPDQIIGLRASGTVMARDIEEAIRSIVGSGGSVPTGLVIIVTATWMVISPSSRAVRGAHRWLTGLS